MEDQKNLDSAQKDEQKSAPLLGDQVAQPAAASETTAPIDKPENKTVDSSSSGTADNKDDVLVDAIVADEADSMLKQQDSVVALENELHKQSLKEKVTSLFQAWWAHKVYRYGTMAALLLLVAIASVVPLTRYKALNLMGVRASVHLQVFDAKTKQPLKNASVTVHGVNGMSDQSGIVTLEEVPLGNTTLKIEKLAFAAVEKNVTIGLGTNPLNTFELNATGAQYTFRLTNFLSSQGVQKLEVSYQESSALSDEDGEAVLTIEPTDAQSIEVQITGDGYRTESIAVATEEKNEIPVAIVPSRPHVFVSKRSGKPVVYKIDVDGKNEQILVEATGKEDTTRMELQQSPDGKRAALVSTRDGELNKDKYLLSGLFLVDMEDGEIQKIDSGEALRIVSWYGSKLVYYKHVDGVSDANPKRERLIAYDTTTAATKELAAANYLYDYLATEKEVLYAPGNLYGDNPGAAVSRVTPEGITQVLSQGLNAWGLYRSSFTEVVLEGTDGKDYTYTLGSTSKPLEKTPDAANRRDYLYTLSPNQKTAVWLDRRDGKQALVLKDTATGEDTVAVALSGIYSPVYWLDDEHVVFRVSTPAEEADYIFAVSGGAARKIIDAQELYNYSGYYY